jgi:hypothetical protein
MRVIDDVHQEQTVRWGCRAGVLPLARLQNGGHRVSGNLGSAHGHECADNRTGHVLQKTIRAEHKDEALGVSDNTQAEEMAPGVARRAGGSPERRKIVTTQEHTGCRTHGGQCERLWYMPGVGGP